MEWTRLAALCGVLFTTALASDVPALIWSPHRSMSDMPQAPVSEHITDEDFHNKYLKPLLDSPCIVTILQDKLHVNDIAKYGDVYNPHGEGGAFKNVKSLVEENFSIELPHVLGSHLALSKLQSSFEGSVYDLNSLADLEDIDLKKNKKYFLIVRLSPVSDAKDEKAAITANDELIGKVDKHLQKRGIGYTAVYTAKSSKKRTERDTHSGRRLMATGTGSGVSSMTMNGTFLAVPYNKTDGNGTGHVLLYLNSVSLSLYPTGCTESKCSISLNSMDINNDTVKASQENTTITLFLTFNNVKSSDNDTTAYNINMLIPMEIQFDRWVIHEPNLTVSNGSGDLLQGAVGSDDYDMIANVMYSYHCTSLSLAATRDTLSNNTQLSNAYITLVGFQVQPFGVTKFAFSLSQDCVGFFSDAIWMALVPIGICLVILFFGMYMLSSLTTNDRFDDPKGKALVVNAGEG